MSRLLSFLLNVFVITGIGLLCLPVFLYLLPYIEQGRTEARLAQTYNEVRRISLELGTKDVPHTHDPAEISGTDRWGKPYQIRRIDDDHVRVMSTGPNMSTTKSGFDDDDIYSDMPVSPMASIQARKNLQMLIAFGATVGVWLFFSVIYTLIRRADFD